MKKSLLICILAVLMCACVLFAACSPSLEADTLNSMKELLYQMYKDSNPATTYTVVGLVASNGQKANIKWDVNVTEGSANDVKVGEIADGEQTIEVNPYPTTDVKYTLTATITNEKGKAYQVDGAPVSISFERSLAKFVVNTYDEYLAACKANDGTTTIRIKAYIIGVVNYESSSKGSLYLQDADGHGYYAYAPTGASDNCSSTEDLRAKWPVGTEVYVNGTVTTYNGQYEYNKNCEILATGKTAEDAGVTLDYADATTAFAAAESNQDTNLGAYQNRRVTLKGAVINRIKIEYKEDGSYNKVYYYFTLPNSNVEFNVYYTIYFINEATMLDLHNKLAVGNQVDLTGIVSVYSKEFQIYPDSANSVSNVVAIADTDEKKVDFAKKNIKLVETASAGEEIELPSTGVLDTTITWAFAEGKTYDGIAKIEGGKLTILAASNEPVELEIVATITSGGASDTYALKVKIPALRTSFIKAALTAGAALENQATTKDSHMIIGTISEITAEYSEQYKNVSFNVIDAEGNALLIYRYNLEDAKDLKVGDFVAFAAPIKKYNTDIEAVSTFVKLDVTTLKAAYDAGTAGKTDAVNVYGYVKSIDTPYDSNYNNITVTISDGTNDLYCYRVKGGADIAVGDYLYISGQTGSYNSKGQLAAASTYVKSSIYVAPTEGGEDEGGDSGSAGTDTPAGPITTIADAVNASEGATVQLSGTVSDITEAWSSYNNMSFYISDGTKKILVFRAGTKVVVGDIVSVSGTITIYSDKAQIAQGATVTVTTAHVCSSWTTATCEDASVCTTCGAEKSEALGHVDENDDNICDRDDCGWILSAVKKSLTITGTTGTMGTKEITWTNDIVTVKNEQASSTTTIRNSDNDHFRAYKSSKLTISISSGTLVRIVVTCQNNSYATALKNSLTTTGATATVSGTTVVITVTGDISAVEFSMTEQTRITGVEVDYIAAE